jgi:hypothetical protein
MDPLISIPYVDIRTATPLDLLRAHLAGAHALMVAASATYGPLGQAASVLALPLGDRASRLWLARTRNPYLDEIAAMARLVRRSGVYFLNVCFEWGCTSGVWRTSDGALLRRVLDWPFPALGEYLLVAHQSGPAGDFLNATWPGLSGVFQASAPGRFAAALNQAPSREKGLGIVGDWLTARFAAAENGGLPPAHLLRRVFEIATDYESAKQMLCDMPLAVPAIFVLAGLEDGCVIEREENAFVVRAMDDKCVCATNHFRGREQGWRARPIDSAGRMAAALALAQTDDFSWFVPPIANPNSRLAMTACPKNGALSLIGSEGPIPVTEIFKI